MIAERILFFFFFAAVYFTVVCLLISKIMQKLPGSIFLNLEERWGKFWDKAESLSLEGWDSAEDCALQRSSQLTHVLGKEKKIIWFGTKACVD